MDAQDKDHPMNPVYNDLQKSTFFTAMRFPTFVLKVSGLYFAIDCSKKKADLESGDLGSRGAQHNNPELLPSKIFTLDEKLKEIGIQNKVMNTITRSDKNENYVCTISRINNSKQGALHRQVFSGENMGSNQVSPNKESNLKSTNMSENTRNNRYVCCRRSVPEFRVFLRYVVSAVVLLLLIWEVVGFLSILPSVISNDNMLAYTLANITFKLFLIFLNVTTSYVTHKHFLPMCYLWMKYEHKYGLGFNLDIFKTWFKTILTISSIISIIVASSVVATIMTSDTQSYYNMWPFDFSDSTQKYVAAFVIGFSNGTGCFATFSSYFLRGAIYFIFLSELNSIRDKLMKILSDGTDYVRMGKDFDDFMEQLRAIRAILDKGFDVTKHCVAAAYIFTPIFACLVLYEWASNSLSWSQTLLTVYTVILGIFMTITTTRLGGRLQDQGRAIWSTVYKVPWCSFSPTMLNKMSIFIQQLSVTDFGYSVYGLFTVDYSSLMMMGGTILTYGIFVLQLKLGNRTVVCEVVNKTC